MKLVLGFEGALVKEYVLDRSALTIGRGAQNDIVIDHMGVSGRHAQVAVEGEVVTLTDLGSANGTFVNGRHVTQAKLQPNDWIAIGRR